MRDVKLERGNFDWGPGGYQAPANGAERVVPFDPPAPHEEVPDPPSQPVQEWSVNASDIMDEFPAGELPQERVNLDRGTAVFRGHTIQLSPEAVQNISEILAEEVCNKLRDEQYRILSSVGPAKQEVNTQPPVEEQMQGGDVP